MERSGGSEHPQGPAGFANPGGSGEPGRAGDLGWSGAPGDLGGPGGPGGSGDPDGPGGPRGLPLPLLPGFREMALRRMAAERRLLVGELAELRRSAGLSQTEVAARMGTSQS